MNSQQRNRVLYEIALSVGEGSNLTETAQNALTAYIENLNCSAGAVIERHSVLEGADYETIATLPPRQAASKGFSTAMARIPDDQTDGDKSFQKSLPITEAADDGSTYYIMELPEFGVLVLVTQGQELDSGTVKELGPLNKKLATACMREHYENQLQAERDRFEAVVSTIDEPLATVRLAHGEPLVQRINWAFETTFGCNEMQAIGHPLSSLVGSKASAEDAIPSLDAGDERESSVTAEIRRETIDKTREFLFRASRIDTETEQTEYLALLVDVTEESIRQRQLERLNEVTNVLSRILRHNIRNDLTVIQMEAERIRQNADGATSESAQTIQQKSEELASTAEKAREMRKVVSMDEDLSSIRLESAITDAIAEVREEYPEAEISVASEIPDDVTVPPLISPVIRNLVENGIEHRDSRQTQVTQARSNDDPPRVTVSTREERGERTITVRDNGPGIPKNEVEILDHPHETDLKHGSGAGLWIVGQIIDYCNASLDFSVDEGGTTATVTVPWRE